MNEKNYKWIKHIIKHTNTTKAGKTIVTQYIVIGKQTLDYNLFLISPLSEFFLFISNNKSTTLISYANVIVPFLNFIDDKNINITNISIQDGVDFLNSLDVIPKTKQIYAGKLEKFFLFLKDRNIIDFSMKENLFTHKYKNTQEKSNKNVIHNLKLEYLPLFINTAIDIVPEIALGVYLQCFGGLRNSEVVSIEYSNISFQVTNDALETMTITLEDKDLRPDIEYSFISKVKRNRKQDIIPAYGDLLQQLYTNHKIKYKSKTTDALFIDENGKPMTAAVYANRFEKLKKAFIKTLENSSSIEARSYALYLNSYKWKTHICRGIFSNNVASTTNNIGDIALWRGDSSMTSALTYLHNKEQVGKDVEKIVQTITTGNWEVDSNV